MIITLRSDGTIVKAIPSNYYQGSAIADDIYIVAPILGTPTIRFTLPSGVVTDPQLTTEFDLALIEPDFAETGYNCWVYSVPKAILNIAGIVYFQVVFSLDTVIQATARGRIIVQEGAGIIIPAEPTPDVWSQIISKITGLEAAVVSTDIDTATILAFIDDLLEIDTSTDNGVKVSLSQDVVTHKISVNVDASGVIIELNYNYLIVPIPIERTVVTAKNTAADEPIALKLYGNSQQSGGMNPFTPAPITNVDSIVNLVTSGKNLANLKTTTETTFENITYRIEAQKFYANKTIEEGASVKVFLSLDATVNSTTVEDFYSYPTIYPPATYTFSLKENSGTGFTSYPRVYFLYSDNTTSEGVGTDLRYPDTTSFTITTAKGIKGAVIDFLGGATTYDLSFGLQLEFEAVETDYVPYDGNVINLDLKDTNNNPIYLRSITDGEFEVADEIYKKGEGEWYFIKRVQENIYDGVTEGASFWKFLDNKISTDEITPLGKVGGLTQSNTYDGAYTLNGLNYSIDEYINGIDSLLDWTTALASFNFQLLYELAVPVVTLLSTASMALLESVKTHAVSTTWTTNQANNVRPILNADQTILGDINKYAVMKDKLGNTVLPFTIANNVQMLDGTWVEDKVNTKLDTEQVISQIDEKITIAGISVNGNAITPDAEKIADITLALDYPIIPVATEGTLVNIDKTSYGATIPLSLYGSSVQAVGTQTPFVPIPITSVNSTLNVVSMGKNLANLPNTAQTTANNLTYRIENQTFYAVKTVTSGTSNVFFLSGTTIERGGLIADFYSKPILYPAGTYRLSYKNKTGTGHPDYYPSIFLLYADNTSSTNIFFPSATTSISITVTKAIKGMAVSFIGGTSTYDLSFNLQLEVGAVESAYVPYISTTSAIIVKDTSDNLIKLRSVKNAEGTYSANDLIYKENDKWYVQKNIQENIYDGVTEGVGFWEYIGDPGYGKVETTQLTPLAKLDSKTYSNLYAGYVYISGAYYNMDELITDINSLSDWTSALAANNLQLLYALATPLKIELHASTSLALDNIITQYNDTNLVTTQPNSVQPIINIEASIIGDTVGYVVYKDALGNTLAPFTKADNVFKADGRTVEQAFVSIEVKSPNSTIYIITVGDNGILSTTAKV